MSQCGGVSQYSKMTFMSHHNQHSRNDMGMGDGGASATSGNVGNHLAVANRLSHTAFNPSAPLLKRRPAPSDAFPASKRQAKRSAHTVAPHSSATSTPTWPDYVAAHTSTPMIGHTPPPATTMSFPRRRDLRPNRVAAHRKRFANSSSTHGAGECEYEPVRFDDMPRHFPISSPTIEHPSGHTVREDNMESRASGGFNFQPVPHFNTSSLTQSLPPFQPSHSLQNRHSWSSNSTQEPPLSPQQQITPIPNTIQHPRSSDPDLTNSTHSFHSGSRPFSSPHSRIGSSSAAIRSARNALLEAARPMLTVGPPAVKSSPLDDVQRALTSSRQRLEALNVPARRQRSLSKPPSRWHPTF